MSSGEDGGVLGEEPEEEFDPYAVLNLPRDCSTKDVHDAFKRLSRTFHPDRHTNRSRAQLNTVNEDVLEASAQAFVRINKAKDILVDSQKRSAYDRFGMAGISLLAQSDSAELRSLKIGKKYRTDKAVHELLRYYFRREVQMELDKIVPSYGQLEVDMDASLLFDEFVDALFRHNSLDHFCKALWHGIPVLNLVVSPNGTLQGFELLEERYSDTVAAQNGFMFPPSAASALPHITPEMALPMFAPKTKSVDNDNDDDKFKPVSFFDKLNTDSFDNNEGEDEEDLFGDYFGEIEEENEDDEENENEEEEENERVVELDLAPKIELIKAGIDANDEEALATVPLGRQSVRPRLGGVMTALVHQYDVDSANSLVFSATQYLNLKQMPQSSAASGGRRHRHGMAAASLFNQCEVEWHRQHSAATQLVGGLSLGSAAVGGKVSVSRAVTARTTMEWAIHVNFLDKFWRNIAAALCPMDATSNVGVLSHLFGGTLKTSRFSLWNPLSLAGELAVLCKDSGWVAFNLLRLYALSVAEPLALESGDLSPAIVDAAAVRYPGFDVSSTVSTALFKDWMGLGGVRLGRSPSFRWKVWKRADTMPPLIGGTPLPRMKEWTFDVSLSKNSGGIEVRRVSRLSKRMRWYLGVSLDLTHLLKIEAGLSRSFVDENLEEMSRHSGAGEGGALSIDARGSVGVVYSATQGLNWDLKVARGPSQCNVPLKLSTEPSLKHILVAAALPLISYALCQYWYKPRAQRKYEEATASHLNEGGLELRNARQSALRQQTAMETELEKRRLVAAADAVEADDGSGVQCDVETDTLEIVAAFYGKHVEKKMAAAIRRQLGIVTESDLEVGGAETEDEEKRSEVSGSYLWGEERAADTAGRYSDRPVFITDERQAAAVAALRGEEEAGRRVVDAMFRISLREIEAHSRSSDWQWIADPCDDSTEDMLLPSWMPVTTVMRFMATPSGLLLNAGVKSLLAGFYDCAPDAYYSKELTVVYRYKGELKTATVGDWMPLEIPNSSHRSWFDCSPM